MKQQAVALAVVVVGAVSLSACAGEKGDGVIDTTFDACAPLLLDAQDGSPEDKLSIAEAARLWNDIAGTRLTVDPAAVDDEDAVVPVFFDEAGDASSASMILARHAPKSSSLTCSYSARTRAVLCR